MKTCTLNIGTISETDQPWLKLDVASRYLIRTPAIMLARRYLRWLASGQPLSRFATAHALHIRYDISSLSCCQTLFDLMLLLPWSLHVTQALNNYIKKLRSQFIRCHNWREGGEGEGDRRDAFCLSDYFLYGVYSMIHDDNDLSKDLPLGHSSPASRLFSCNKNDCSPISHISNTTPLHEGESWRGCLESKWFVLSTTSNPLFASFSGPWLSFIHFIHNTQISQEPG